MAFDGARAKSSATSVGEKAAVAAAVAWTQRRRDPVASTPQTSAALTRAPASPSETGKAAPPPVPSLRAPVLPSHHHLRSSPPPVPLLWSVKGSGEGRSKEAVEAGPPGMPFSTTARAPRRLPVYAAKKQGKIHNAYPSDGGLTQATLAHIRASSSALRAAQPPPCVSLPRGNDSSAAAAVRIWPKSARVSAHRRIVRRLERHMNRLAADAMAEPDVVAWAAEKVPWPRTRCFSRSHSWRRNRLRRSSGQLKVNSFAHPTHRSSLTRTLVPACLSPPKEAARTGTGQVVVEQMTSARQ